MKTNLEKKWTVEEKEISESSGIGEIRRGRRIPDQGTVASSKPLPV